MFFLRLRTAALCVFSYCLRNRCVCCRTRIGYLTTMFNSLQYGGCYTYHCLNIKIWKFAHRTQPMYTYIQNVPLATEPGISLIILPLMRILQRNLTHATDTFLFISHTTKVLLFKFRCNIFIGVRIVKEMQGFGSEWDTLYIHRIYV